MRTRSAYSTFFLIAFLALVLHFLSTEPVSAQGSIFGAVNNSDASVPANGEISFIGYLDDTDEEIRIETSDGAGYDAGFWYDDFQNYLTEAAGNPYDYHFFNLTNGEGFILSDTIPSNSFQREDVALAPVGWPQPPSGLSGQTISAAAIVIRWNHVADQTCHLYRRPATANGSFFRIDDLNGSLLNPGIADSFFVDTSIPGAGSYHYLIVAEDAGGNWGPHSDFINVSSGVIESPEIFSITPDSGLTTGGTEVTILGRGFDPSGATVTIGGAELASLAVISPFEITGITPPGEVGPADVVVTNTASGLSSAPLVSGFIYQLSTVPLVADIPDQTILEGSAFNSIKLDDYVSDVDHTDDQIIWSYSGNVELDVSINVNRIASIQIPSPSWSGSETIVFRATDPDSLYDEDTATFTVTYVNDPPVVADIPDQAIIGDGAYTVINLDDFVSDPDNHDSTIIWSVSGALDLAVDITDRVATVTIANVDWSGTESIVFHAADPGGESAVDTVAFVQVKFAAAANDFGNVLIGQSDTIPWAISTPADFMLAAPQINTSNATVSIAREDGGNVNADIPPGTERIYLAIWMPDDTLDSPGDVTISSTSVDDDEIVAFDGRPVMIELTPELASHDFGDVNAVDRRAADTLRLQVTVGGNIGGTYQGIASEDIIDDFSILSPAIGDTLRSGEAVNFVILSHPQNTGSISTNLGVKYGIDLGDGPVVDSLELLNLSGNGVEPGCAVMQDTINFYVRKVGPVYTLPLTLSNSSTVHEIIDSIYFTSNANVFWIDSALNRPLFLPPGDTTFLIYFRPRSETSYAATLAVVDSNVVSDCNPPTVLGSGVFKEIHWEPDAPLTIGPVRLCDSAAAYAFRITNRIIGFNMVVDDITVDSTGWFTFFPDLSMIIGSAYSPGEDIEFDSILFAPPGLLPETTFDLNLKYHVDTAGAAIESVIFGFVDQTGGCAGVLEPLPPVNFAAVNIWLGLADTITLINSGECSLQINDINIDNDDFSISGVSMPIIIASGDSYKLKIFFDPSIIGSVSGNLTIEHDGYVTPFDPALDCPLGSQTVVALSGTGTDTAPPQISEVIAYSCGRIMEIVATDFGIGIESVSTSWRRGNALGGFTPTANSPTYIGTNHWQFSHSEHDFPGDSVDIFGYEIRVIALDGAGNADTVIQSVAGCISKSIDGAGQISAEKLLGGNGRDSLWHLVSFPGNLATYRIDKIFCEFSGLPPSTDDASDPWRLYEYQDTVFSVLVTDDPSNAIKPGQGYWFRHFLALDTLRLDTAGSAHTWATVPAFGIHLDYGWNLIGSPYLFAVYINESLIDRDSLSSFLSQAVPAVSGGKNWWAVSDIGSGLPPLEPWKGYALWCENPDGYSIYLDPHFNPVPAGLNTNGDWVSTISLSNPAGIIGQIEIGINSLSSDGPDLTDVRSVAFFNKNPRLDIDNPSYGSFVRDIRLDSELHIWKLRVSTIDDGPFTLAWSHPAIDNREKMIVLYDAVTGNITDMESATEYLILNPAQLPEGRFNIIMGNHDAVKEAIGGGLSERPVTFHLYQNYPNPFNPVTTIAYDLPQAGHVTVDLFNILGQLVDRIVDDYRESGSYQVKWDGRDAASGVYFYRITATDYSATRKMILLK